MIRAILSRQRNRRILLASGAGLAQRVVQLVATLITLPLVLHSLGVAGFGVWGAATSLAWLSGMLDLGLGSALVTLLPRDLKDGAGHAGAHVGAALFGGGVLAAVLLAAGGIVILAGFVHPRAAFDLAGVALAVNIPLSIAANIWLGLQKGHVGAYWQLVQTLLTLALLVAAALAGAGVTVMVAAVYGALVVSNAGSLGHVLARHEALRPALGVRLLAMREVLTQGGMLFAITIAGCCTYVFDNVMALDWLGPNASAQMAIALRICLTATGILSVLSLPFWPGFADAMAANDHDWQWRTLRNGSLVTLALSLSGCALIMLFGEDVLRWWLRGDLQISQALLWVISGWIVTHALPFVPGLLLNAALRLRPQIYLQSAAAIAGFILKFYAARCFGVVGILAVIPALWLFFVVPGYFALAWRQLAKPDGTAFISYHRLQRGSG